VIDEQTRIDVHNGQHCNFVMVPFLLGNWREPNPEDPDGPGLPLDPYVKALYLHYVQTGYEAHGPVSQTLRETAAALNISPAQVLRARNKLVETGWLKVEVEGNVGHQITRITLIDRWAENCPHTPIPAVSMRNRRRPTVSVVNSAVSVVNSAVSGVNSEGTAYKERAPVESRENRDIGLTDVRPAPSSENATTSTAHCQCGCGLPVNPGKRFVKGHNASGRFIDALKALGVEVVLGPRDHAALAGTNAEPALVAEVYKAVRDGKWGDKWHRSHLSVHSVVDWISAYVAERRPALAQSGLGSRDDWTGHYSPINNKPRADCPCGHCRHALANGVTNGK
jgi:hypothetical protein